MKGKEIVSIKRKKKYHTPDRNHVLSKIRYIKEKFIHVSGNTTTLSPHYLQDYLSSRRQGAGLRNYSSVWKSAEYILKRKDPHERSVSRFLQTIQPPSPLSSSTNGIKKRKQAAYIVLNTRIYDASPVLREQSRGDFLPSRKTGLRGAQEGVSRVSCTKVGKGGRGRRRKKRRTERGNIEKEKLTWW